MAPMLTTTHRAVRWHITTTPMVANPIPAISSLAMCLTMMHCLRVAIAFPTIDCQPTCLYMAFILKAQYWGTGSG